MSSLLNNVDSYTFENYMKKFNDWMLQGQTSSKDSSPLLIKFTKLNWTRAQRLHKTILIKPEIVKAIEKTERS